MKKLSHLLLPLIGLFLCSCGTFERQWKQSVADYQSGKVAAPAGPWVGTWTTKTNGHTGDLRAIITPDDSGNYKFHYHATWGKFFSGAYQVKFPVTGNGGHYRADGEKSLGVFGTFGHKATITRNSFQATYSNQKGDLGDFSMKRPE